MIPMATQIPHIDKYFMHRSQFIEWKGMLFLAPWARVGGAGREDERRRRDGSEWDGNEGGL